MYSELLIGHSWLRWIIVIGLFYVLFISHKGRRNAMLLKPLHLFPIIALPTICLTQLTLGFLLYLQSPFVTQFFANFPESLKHREIRFFGIEHSTVMPIAISLIIIGSVKAYKQRETTNAYNIWFKWTLFAFILIIFSIPWSFWPLVSRPLFRLF